MLRVSPPGAGLRRAGFLWRQWAHLSCLGDAQRGSQPPTRPHPYQPSLSHLGGCRQSSACKGLSGDRSVVHSGQRETWFCLQPDEGRGLSLARPESAIQGVPEPHLWAALDRLVCCCPRCQCEHPGTASRDPTLQPWALPPTGL